MAAFHYSPAARLLSSQFADALTGANTNETDLFTYTLKGKSLRANGVGVRGLVWGKTSANANTKRIRLYWGGVMFFDSTALAANNKDWWLAFEIVRTGVGTQKILITGVFNAALVSTVAAGTIDETADQIIKATGTNGTATAADITGSRMVLEYLT